MVDFRPLQYEQQIEAGQHPELWEGGHDSEDEELVKLSRASSVEEYKLISSYESVRQALLQDKYADRLDKPLAYWALPSDRRLPLAFLGRTLRELLNTPFPELSATPGIGQKKIHSFVKLLVRATKEDPAIARIEPELEAARSTNGNGHSSQRIAKRFDPGLVSEALWSQWRETVKRHKLGSVKLGRIAPSLQALPTVIWHTPLEFYSDYSLSQIRNLKTHGEKRVRVVLEVFHTVHQLFGDATPQPHLTVRLLPRFVDHVEGWVAGVTSGSGAVGIGELKRKFIRPILEQLQIDTSSVVLELVQGRLGLSGPPQSVRTQSKALGLTRARVYQLLEECARVMEVRWPEGDAWVDRLEAKLELDNRQDELKLYRGLVELCFPSRVKASLERGELCANES